MTNYDDQTGLPYGVMAVHSDEAQWLFDDIRAHGQNLTYSAARAELEQSLRRSFGDPPYGTLEEAEEVFESDGLMQDLRMTFDPDLYDEQDGTFDLEALLAQVIDRWHDAYQPDEEEYEWVVSPTEAYLVSWLGGAPLIWVTRSAYATPCHQCSPCVPGAGDLDSPGSHDELSLALCPPPTRVDYADLGYHEVFHVGPAGQLLESIYKDQTHADT